MPTSSGARLPWQPIPEADDEIPEASETIEPRPGDWTSRLARVQRKDRDVGIAEDDPDAAWLGANRGTQTTQTEWR